MKKNALDIFRSAIKKLIKEKKKAEEAAGRIFTQAMVANSMGVDPNNLSAFLNGHRQYSEAKREDLSRFFGKTYLEVLGINEDQTSSNTEKSKIAVNELQQRKNEQHHQIIDHFKNHELAIEINQILIEIEAIDKEELEEVKEMMLIKLRGLKRKFIGRLSMNGTTGGNQ